MRRKSKKKRQHRNLLGLSTPTDSQLSANPSPSERTPIISKRKNHVELALTPADNSKRGPCVSRIAKLRPFRKRKRVRCSQSRTVRHREPILLPLITTQTWKSVGATS